MVPIMICSISLARDACEGVSPVCHDCAPITSINGDAASKAAFSPPQMNSNSPLAASRHPPLTGAARNLPPVALITLALLSPVASSTVEQST